MSPNSEQEFVVKDLRCQAKNLELYHAGHASLPGPAAESTQCGGERRKRDTQNAGRQGV